MYWHGSVTIKKKSKPAKRQAVCHISNMLLTRPILNYSSSVISVQIYVKEGKNEKVGF